jgi:hypothetical protein
MSMQSTTEPVSFIIAVSVSAMKQQPGQRFLRLRKEGDIQDGERFRDWLRNYGLFVKAANPHAVRPMG